MSWNTARRFTAMLLVVVVVTRNFQPTVSLHTQRCVGGGCKLTCAKSLLYNSCQQICTGGNCDLACHAAEKCDFSCTAGSCKPILCTARTCDLSCTGGGCEMDCKGEHCKASCTSGRCILKCPENAKTCNLRCTVGPCNTVRPTPFITPTVPTVRPTLPPRIHFQTCFPGGGCTCPRSSNYYRCNQVCIDGRCPLTCHASDICDMSCTGGNCKPFLCDSKTCDLSCTGGRCEINCRGKLCKAICTGGSCPVTCHSTDRCNIMCTRGNCKPILCTAKTCDLSCTGGGCEMDCRGEHCEASCTGGRCTLKCPPNAKTCNLRCTGGPCKTIRPTSPTIQPTLPPRPHIQKCVQGGCSLTCPRSSNFNECEQICTGGSCSLTCHSSDRCDMTCTGGSCKPVLCTAKTCDLSCTSGGCDLDCRGEHCKASCTGGRCTLKCPANAKTCNLRCTVGPCKTIRPPTTALTTVPPKNPLPTTPRNPSYRIQTCARPKGGCRFTCPRRPNYSLCVQNCNTGKWSFFFKIILIVLVFTIQMFLRKKGNYTCRMCFFCTWYTTL